MSKKDGYKEYYDELAMAHVPRSHDQIFRDAYMNILTGCSWKAYNRVYTIERLVLRCISEGNVEMASSLFMTDFADIAKETGVFSYDKIKDCEYICVISVALYAHAAVSGGASIQTVFALRNALLQKISELHRPQDYYELNYEAVIIFSTIVQHSHQRSIKNHKMAEIISYIKNNLNSRLTVQELSQQFHMNPDYLSRNFFAETGVSIKSYIQQIRISAACDLMIYSDLSLSDIAAITGFSSQSYFGEVFAKVKGTTPAAFRVLQKQKSLSPKNIK